MAETVAHSPGYADIVEEEEAQNLEVSGIPGRAKCPTAPATVSAITESRPEPDLRFISYLRRLSSGLQAEEARKVARRVWKTFLSIVTLLCW